MLETCLRTFLLSHVFSPFLLSRQFQLVTLANIVTNICSLSLPLSFFSLVRSTWKHCKICLQTFVLSHCFSLFFVSRVFFVFLSKNPSAERDFCLEKRDFFYLNFFVRALSTSILREYPLFHVHASCVTRCDRIDRSPSAHLHS